MILSLFPIAVALFISIKDRPHVSNAYAKPLPSCCPRNVYVWQKKIVGFNAYMPHISIHGRQRFVMPRACSLFALGTVPELAGLTLAHVTTLTANYSWHIIGWSFLLPERTNPI